MTKERATFLALIRLLLLLNAGKGQRIEKKGRKMMHFESKGQDASIAQIMRLQSHFSSISF